jgi:uroporphyrinogen decarboxylase
MQEMTPRERWMAVLNREQPDRLPTDYWATPEFNAKLKKAAGCADDESLWRKLGIDRPCILKPRCKLKHHPDDPLADEWGIRRKAVSYSAGAYDEVVHSPLARVRSVEEVHQFRWPGADDYDYTPIAEAVAGDDGYRLIFAGIYEPFLLYGALRGLEQSFEDLVVNPDIADAILGHLFDFHFEHHQRIFEAGRGRIGLSFVAEDLGSQTGPLMSLECYRRFLLANQKKMADLVRSFGAHVIYHTDGAARVFLPDLVDVVGIEILNPIQWRCPGMDREGLARDFGSRIAFHGAIDNQQTLPFGTVDDVVREVRETARIFKGCRWICAPCHNIQPVSPVENVLAMYETAHSIRWP